MSFNDGIPKSRSFSLTDLHDYDFCPFRFYVKHHLGKKYEIEDSNPRLALGTLLDESIKRFHLAKAYGCDDNLIKSLVTTSYNFIRSDALEKGPKSFNGVHYPFMDEIVLDQAVRLFQNYYLMLGKKIKMSLGKVGFCERVIDSNSGKIKLWGGPDTFEQGADGIPEICDYKFHLDSERGKLNLDMDLMPKFYTLLSTKPLSDKGYNRVRFVVRLWQEPGDNSFYEEFDLAKMSLIEELLKQRIEQILSVIEFYCCEKSWCKACQSVNRKAYLSQLSEMNLRINNQAFDSL